MNGTAFSNGLYIDFQAAVLKQLPRPGDITPEIAKAWADNQASLKGVLAKILLQNPPFSKSSSSILKLIPSDPLIIKACDGTRTIVNAKDVFQSGIYFDEGCEIVKSSRGGEATPETLVRSYSLVKNGTLKEIVASLVASSNLDKCFFTENQVVLFCEEHVGEILQGRNTFFLFKLNGKNFVATVYVDVFSHKLRGFRVCVDYLEHGFLFLAEHQYRLVVPQL